MLHKYTANYHYYYYYYYYYYYIATLLPSLVCVRLIEPFL